MALAFWQEAATAPSAGKVKIRVINTTNAPIDVRPYIGTAVAVQAAAPPPEFTAIPAYTASAYIEVDSATVGDATATPAIPATSWFLNVRAAGSATNLFTDIAAVNGAPQTCSGLVCKKGEKADVDASPGVRVAGSAVSGIVFPRSTAGSRATSFTTPGITYMWDLRPARACDPYC